MVQKVLALLLKIGLFWLKVACSFLGTKDVDVPNGNCPFLIQKLLVLCLVQNLLVLLFETAILGANFTCVIFGTKCTGIVI